MGIGVQKSATSWMFRSVVEHPELRGSVVDGGDKELNFFDHRYEYGYEWYESPFLEGSWRNVEFSVLYFHDRNVPARIRRYNPHGLLLLCAFHHRKVHEGGWQVFLVPRCGSPC